MLSFIQEARNRGDADMLEVPHASVMLGREIGKGAFGRVFIARATNICGRAGIQLVAVKQLKSELCSSRRDKREMRLLLIRCAINNYHRKGF